MKIGFDGRPLFTPTRGIGVYMWRLLENLLDLDLQINVSLHLRREVKELFSHGYLGIGPSIQARYPERVSICERRFPPIRVLRWIWRSSNFLPLDRTLGGVDIYHSTNFVTPPLRKARSIVTIYDLIMLFPEFHVPLYPRKELARYIDRADVIIAISENTKRDIISLFGVPEEKVRVILLAADERFRCMTDNEAIQNVLKRAGIAGEYILYTGPMELRKNVPALVQAFGILKAEKRIPHRLVLAGSKGGGLYAEIMEIIRAHGLEKDVVFTGYVADEDIPCLYNNASVFAFPSLYEGFGLPPLEAMACGCPVVTSNTSSLPEVVGDAGLMVDPECPEELAEAMGRVIEDTGLRSKLRERGLRRAAEFSWKRCATETLAIYRELL